MAATETAPFADDFAPATEENWVTRVEAALKGAPLQKLVSKTYDGFEIKPLYPRAAGKPRAFRSENEWSVVARVDHPDAETANGLALTDLENGANGLHLAFAGSVGAYGFGLKDAASLATALRDVHLDAGVKIVLDLPAQADPFVAAWLDLVSARGYDPKTIDVSFGLDPIGAAIAQGVVVDWVQAGYGLATQAALLASHGFDKGLIAADGRVVHAAGGSPAQELAFALASGLASLRALEAGGVDLEAARNMIDFRLAADADEFVTLAKFRALRRLWAAIERACGLEPAPIRVHGETAWRMMTRRDPWVNFLRETVAVFSAGLGGAEFDLRPALHPGARPAGRLRPPPRPQHPTGAAGGIQSRQGRRSRGGLGRRRGAHRRPGRTRLRPDAGHREGRRTGRGARGRPRPGRSGEDRGRADEKRLPPQGAAHRRQRISRHP